MLDDPSYPDSIIPEAQNEAEGDGWKDWVKMIVFWLLLQGSSAVVERLADGVFGWLGL